MRNKELIEKWGPVLEHSALPSIKDAHRKAVTAQLLENTENALKEGSSYSPASFLSEAAPANSTAVAANYDPVLITLVRRAMPNLIAYDIAGVQPMTGPTGLIFAMRSNYANTTAATAEAFYNEADTDFSGTGTHTGSPFPTDFANTSQWGTGSGLSTAAAERLGMGGSGDGDFGQMSFSIEKVSVTAKSRALKAEYTTELAQDLKAIHGLDAESELASMLQAELLAEINREVVRTVYNTATVGAASGTTATVGTFDLDVDANGRWSVEKFKGLMFQIEREANQIAKDTRRGKGNILICSSDVASALQMAGILDYTPALNANALNVDDTGNTFAGVLNGRFRVYIDPYAGSNYMVIGYKGSSTFDAGMFYCPYVPLQMVRAVGENSFQSKLGFKTRYGMVANPFAEGTTVGAGALTANANKYYRKVRVTNIL
jgi:hypothetical protein